MTQEEKAKAYDEAIEIAKKELNACGSQDCDAAKQIFRLFPELKGSEDEKIKKVVKSFMENYLFWEKNELTKEKALAWLEKQGEQKSHKERIDEINRKVFPNHYGGYAPVLETEQKPTDKVEPKFKVGDIIKDTEDGEVFTIRTITKDKYIYTDDSFDWIKDQDEYELVEQKSTELGENRSKELSLSLQIQAYLNTASDELYAKGKPLYSEDRIKDIHKCMLMWQKLHNAYFYQKHAWSEEDEEMLENIICDINTARQYVYVKSKCDEEIDWLKSLKDRVQPKPKQEWSEEDKKMLDKLYYLLRLASETPCSNRVTLISDKESIELENWLKSLKDRYAWKPSDEQMKALEKECIAHSNYELCRLLDQLKKLREG